MSGLVFKSEDRDAFLAAMKAMKKPALEHRRMNILLLLDDGIAPSVIARMLDLDERTVDEYRGWSRSWRKPRMLSRSPSWIRAMRSTTACLLMAGF
jgi:DNA-binding NarL/FixJ family response regulator